MFLHFPTNAQKYVLLILELHLDVSIQFREEFCEAYERNHIIVKNTLPK